MDVREVGELLNMLQILTEKYGKLPDSPELEEVERMARNQVSLERMLEDIKSRGIEAEKRLILLLQWYYETYKPETWNTMYMLSKVNPHLTNEDIRMILAGAPVEKKSDE